MEPKFCNLNTKNNPKENYSNIIGRIYCKNKNTQKSCNCLCCKYCNDYWRPYKKSKEHESIQSKTNKIQEKLFLQQQLPELHKVHE